MTTKLASSAPLNQTLCVKMAVGSNVEATPSVSRVEDHTPGCPTGNRKHCFGLPYQDHNYGAPPPPPPTPPLSPNFECSSDNLQLGNTGTSSCFNPDITRNHKICLKQISPLVSKPAIGTASFPSRNGLIKMENLPSKDVPSLQSNDGSDSNVNHGDVTRCICGFSHDDGYMICCDKCTVWQHIDCMGIDRNHIPDVYLCELCKPRVLNREEATRLQARKRDGFLNLESSGTESGDDKNKILYKAVQSTPTSLTITTNRTAKKLDTTNAGKKRKRSKDDSKKCMKKIHLGCHKRSRSKSSCNDNTDDDRVGVTFTWAAKLKEWNESYHEMNENLYTAELLQAVLSSNKSNNSTPKESVLSKLRKQLAKVQQLRSRIMAMEDICVSEPVAEVIGSYMLSNQTEAGNSALFKRPYPYMFFYNGFDGLEVCVDSRSCGNITRFLRRSCCPNCEIRHVMEDNKLHLLIYSKENISNGSEITIPYDFKYQNCLYNVECSCGRLKNCPVFKVANSRMERYNEGKQPKEREVSPLRLSLSRIHQNTNGFASSDQETSNVGDGEQDAGNHESRRKKSREDRKMEAYIRAFEIMERKEKKKEQLHHTNSSPSDISNTPLKPESLHNSLSMTSLPETTPAPTSQLQPVFDEETSATVPSAVTPMRRTNRRKSTKGNRKGSYRNHAPSFEDVMSPSLSMETDSNHSCDTLTMPDMISSDSSGLPPLTIEPISCSSETDKSVAVEKPIDCLLSNQTTWDQKFTEKGTENSNENTSIKSNTPCLTTEMVTCKNVVDTLQVLQNEITSSGENENISCSHNLEIKDTNDATVITTNTCSLVSAAFPVAQVLTSTSSSSKSVKSRKITSSIDSSAGNTQVVSVAATCAFVSWHYRPGVPSGRVHIGLGLQTETKYPSEKFLKKKWLQMASEDNLIPPNNSKDDIQLSNSKGHAFKKHLLKKYYALSSNTLKEQDGDLMDTTDLNCSKTDVTDICVKTNEGEQAVELGDQHQSEASTSLDHNTQQSNVSVITTNVLSRDPILTGNGNPSLPTIEYENISDDDDDASNSRSIDVPVFDECSTSAEKCHDEELQPVLSESQQENFLSTAAAAQLNGDLQVNFNPSIPYNEVVETSFDSSSNQENNLLTNLQTQEDVQTIPGKKKVSLQEYLKRSKDTRKSITVESTPASKPMPASPTLHSTISSSASDFKIIRPKSLDVLASPTVSFETNSGTSSSSISGSNLSSSTEKQLVDTPSKVVENLSKPLDDVFERKEKTVDFNNLTQAAVRVPSSEVIDIGKKATQKLSEVRPDSNKQEKPQVSRVVDSTTKLSRRRATVDDKNLAKLKSEPASPTASKPTSLRPYVERSNSSPNVKHLRNSGNATVATSRKSSPSQRTSHGARKAYLEGSPATPASVVSPRSSRGQSVSSRNSPSTPTIYDSRHRHEFKEHTTESKSRSRHSSDASSENSNTVSSKSPRYGHSDSRGIQYNKHSNYASTSQFHKDARLHEPPQKVQSLTPAVPGQPIPSLMRGPGGGRVPQVIYNRRHSPRPESNHHSREPPRTSLKDLTYARSDSYYYPSRPPSPPCDPYYAYSRHDKLPHFDDQYSHRPIRRDYYPPGKSNPPPASHYHLSYSPGPGPPVYDDRRPSYCHRDTRPPSPPPLPRHNLGDYYGKGSSDTYKAYYPDMHHR